MPRGELGAIRPHGLLLALEEHDLAIALASANTWDMIGIPHERVLGAGIATVLAVPTERELRELLATTSVDDINPLRVVSVGGASYDAILHRTDGLVVIELEAVAAHSGIGALDRAIARLEHTKRPSEVSRIAVEEIRGLVGFERVALYRHRAGVVELAASASEEDAPPAFIALDADESIRYSPDIGAVSIPLVALTPRPFSLARCVLREVPGSGEGARLAIRLGTWGTVVCEHATPKHVAFTARHSAQLLARFVAWHLTMCEQLGDELRASNMAKDEFLATVSHELRTPLNAMLGWLRLIEAGQVTPDRESQAFSTVTRNANVLAQLVEELLDVSRVITGKMRIDLQPVIPAGIVETALASVQPTAEAKGITLRTQIDPLAGPVLADSGRLQQVVWNLLTNAIKFTGEGGTIQVQLRRSGGAVEIEVTDTGAGIDPAVLPHVFERFRQGEDATTRVQGLGLGLAIVRHLVELHGGDVNAHSAGKGRGATFTVRLPIATGRTANVHASDAAPPAFEPVPQLRGLRVLAVDDERDANDLLRAVLQTSGVEVTTASSANEALMLLNKVKPNVLISDIGMPGTDGYALIQELRKLPDALGGRIPAIAITAFARVHDRSRAFLAGFDVFLAKPIDPGELLAVLTNLSGRRSTGTIKVPRAESEPKLRSVLAETRILVVDDDRDNAEMLGVLLEIEGATVELAHSAGEGMAKIRAFRPHVLVSDIGLPDKDGFAFVRELRATGSDEGGWIPAIALSGHADSDHAREAILAGFQLHVAKPIDPPDLIARLARLVGRTVRRT